MLNDDMCEAMKRVGAEPAYPVTVGTRSNEMQTLGDYRVGVDFNPSGDGQVKRIKDFASGLINLIEAVPDNGDPEIIRLKALGKTEAESAAMWGVKAATKKPR